MSEISRQRNTRIWVLILRVALWSCAAFPLVLGNPSRAQAPASDLKLLISVEQPRIAAPYPAHITLNLHNAGKETLWLLRRARPPRPPERILEEENAAPKTSGGTTLTVKLEPVGGTNTQRGTTPAKGTVLDTIGLPRPKLVRVEPGEDFEQKATVQLAPAQPETGGKAESLWGRYRFSVAYKAEFSTAEEIHRNLGTTLWQGEATSNTVEIELLAPPPTAQGSAAGAVVRPDSAPILNARVSLSDEENHLLAQQLTDSEGRFSFSDLPLGLYWLTTRREYAPEDITTYRHVELTSGEPSAAVQLVLLPEEIYEAKKLLHKPVLFLVVDSGGHPLANVGLEITYSNGPILDNVKAETGADGLAAVELVPGRNFVTLKRRGCPKQEERADVATGEGVDDFRFVSDCSKQ